MVAAGCASGTTEPTAPVTVAQTFQISCPASIAAESVSGTPIPIVYAAPTISAGVVPVTSTCAPASGSSFSVGTTTVNCSATDGTQKSISCAFSVSVTRPGLLSSTKFLAFGDSMTEGALAQCPVATTGFTPHEFLLRDLAMIRASVNVPTSYPAVLTSLLLGRYLSQGPSVTNVGLSGERVSDTTWGTNDVTIARLRAEMAAYSPQIVLLMEGVNDINGNALHPEVTWPAAVKGLRDLAREARQRGASQVFIATLPPQQPGACRAYTASQIAGLNEQIRSMVAADRHVLVDVFGTFGGVAGSYIGPDGLHPNALGYQKMAQTFFDVIRQSLEVPR